jgi:glycosyltransferase involved in cell wall biosynthesis
MNVAVVVPDPAIGPDVRYGDSVRLRLLAAAIESLGHQVQMLWAETAHGRPVAAARRLPVPDAVRPLLRDVRTLARARRYRRETSLSAPPDVVLEFASYLAPAGLRLARRLGVPYVVEVEGPLGDLRYEAGGSPLRRVGDRWLREQLRAAASVLTVSRALADHVVALGAAESTVVVAPNVADTAVFAPSDVTRARARAELGIAAETFVVGFHGVFSPWYALPTLVGAVSGQPSESVCVLLVGDGVDRRAVEEAASASSARVIVTGLMPQDRAAELIQAADVGVVPDHAWWTSPLKLFEFGALRKPVVAARVPSITAVAGEDEVAMFDPADPTGLANLLRELASDTPRRASLAEAWHARVLRDYTVPALRANVAEALDRAVS